MDGKKIDCGMKLYSIATIGPKGQVVIPKEIRDKLGLQKGNTVSILLKDDKYIGIIRNDDLNELMEYINIEK